MPLAVLLVAGCLLLQIAVHQIVLPILGKNLSASAALVLGIVAPSLVVVWWACHDVAMVLRLNRPPTSSALAIVGLAASFALLASSSLQLLVQMGRLPLTIVRLLEQEERLFREAFSFSGPLDAITLGLALIVLGPLAEEMLFRGLLQGSLERRLGGWSAVIVSGLAFAVLHGQLRFLPMGLFGILLGYVVWRTNSLFAGILAHAVNNSMVLILSFVAEASLFSKAELIGAITLGGLGLLASLRLFRSATVHCARIVSDVPPTSDAVRSPDGPDDQLTASPFETEPSE